MMKLIFSVVSTNRILFICSVITVTTIFSCANYSSHDRFVEKTLAEHGYNLSNYKLESSQESELFAEDYDFIVEATKEAIIDSGIEIIESSEINDKAYRIIAGKVIAGQWRQLVKITVSGTDDNNTMVFIRAKRFFEPNIEIKKDYSKDILKRIK